MVAGRCAHCGDPALRGRRTCSPGCARAWSEQHVWVQARIVALAAAGYACELCGALDWDVPIDVHHRVPVEPVVGYRAGCQHHASNLEVLCRIHHIAVHEALRAKPGTQLRLCA